MYALAGMQFEERGPHRFRELEARVPGLVYPILNIKVLAASLISRSPCRGFAAPGVLRFALSGRQRITPSCNSVSGKQRQFSIRQESQELAAKAAEQFVKEYGVTHFIRMCLAPAWPPPPRAW